MAKGLRRWLGLAAVLLWLAACASPERPKPEVWRHGVTVSAEHSGSSIELDRDQELVVRLTTASNNTFEWSLVELAPGVLAELDAAKFERESRVTNFNDAAGAEVWRFRPAGAGSVTLKFEYRRAHSLDPATQTVTYSVTVR